MKKLIKSQLALRNQKQTDIALWLGISRQTVNYKMNHPDNWTIGELKILASKWKLNVKELIQ